MSALWNTFWYEKNVRLPEERVARAGVAFGEAWERHVYPDGAGEKEEIAQRRTLLRLKLRSSAFHRFSETISHLVGFIVYFILKILKSKTSKSRNPKIWRNFQIKPHWFFIWSFLSSISVRIFSQYLASLSLSVISWYFWLSNSSLIFSNT